MTHTVLCFGCDFAFPAEDLQSAENVRHTHQKWGNEFVSPKSHIAFIMYGDYMPKSKVVEAFKKEIEESVTDPCFSR